MYDPAREPTFVQFLLSEEAYKIYLQFFLVTVLAGVAAMTVQLMRDREARTRADREVIRELFLRIDELYRSTKQVKRLLRSRATAIANKEWLIDSQVFSSQMDELSRIQLSLEQCWQTIRSRSDLLPLPVREAIGDLLGYSESYLHDVVEEFEKRTVRREDQGYTIHKNCLMLMDFVGERHVPDLLKPYAKIIRNGKSTLKEKQAALASVDNLRRKAKKDDKERAQPDASPSKMSQRFKVIFEESLLAVISELREYASGKRLERIDAPVRSSDFTNSLEALRPPDTASRR